MHAQVSCSQAALCEGTHHNTNQDINMKARTGELALQVRGGGGEGACKTRLNGDCQL